MVCRPLAMMTVPVSDAATKFSGCQRIIGPSALTEKQHLNISLSA